MARGNKRQLEVTKSGSILPHLFWGIDHYTHLFHFYLLAFLVYIRLRTRLNSPSSV